MLRIAVYCRVSTDKDDQKNSLESQKNYFKNEIAKNADWQWIQTYADEGISGTATNKRTAFNRMLNSARKGEFDMIITKEVSRFARNTVDALQYTRELKALGIGVLFVNDHINTLDCDGELRLTIMASLAQEESRKTSERVKWGQKRQMEKGVVFGRGVLGYDLKNGVLTVNREEAELVKHIYNKYLDGKGLHVIARELRAEGYRTKTGKSEWTNKAVRTILQNEKYTGDLLQKKTVTVDFLTHKKKCNCGEEEFVYIKDHHEPVIDREVFDFVQAEFKRKAEEYGITNAKHSNRYAFSGKIKCGHCGRSYVANFRKRKDGSKRKIWNCYNKVRNGAVRTVNGEQTGCDNCEIGNDVLECAVLKALNELCIDKSSVVAHLKRTVGEVLRKEQREQYDFAKTRNLIEQLKVKKMKSINSYYENEITKDEFIELKAKYQNEMGCLEKEMQAMEKIKCDDNILLMKIYSKIEKLLAFEEFDECTAKEIIEKIVVNGKNDVEVHLKGVGEDKRENFG